jgi:type I restriction enzyme S subunit
VNLTSKRISELGRVVTGKTPPTSRQEFFGGEYLFITPSDLEYDHYYCRNTERTVTEEAKSALPNQFIPPDAVMFTCIGATIGKCGIAPAECLTNQQINSVVANEHTDSKFLYYLLCHNVDLVKGLGGGAATPIVSKSKFEEVELLVPSFRGQQVISAVLSAYDDLIENNRRRMALLEEAARQLYREWFVRLRFPGHEHTRITNGVPEGWKRIALADACESLEDGDWVESKDQGGEDYRLLQISNIGVNEFVETGNFRYVAEETFNRLNCREILPGQILISRMPKPIGRAWLVTEMPWRMITAVDVAIVAPNPDIADQYFLTYFLNSPENLQHCERRAVGATRPRVARRELASLPLLLPPSLLQRSFREAAEPLNLQRANLYRQNEKLHAARDLLLPRLMSGEIAV